MSMEDVEELSNALIRQARGEGISRYTVGCIVERSRGQILLLKRTSGDFMGGMYEIPGGLVETGESLSDALRRETLEETGLKVTDIRHYEGHFDYNSGSGRKTRQFNFLASVGSGRVKISNEHEDYAWVNRNTVENYRVSDSVMGLVKKHFEMKTRV